MEESFKFCVSFKFDIRSVNGYLRVDAGFSGSVPYLRGLCLFLIYY